MTVEQLPWNNPRVKGEEAHKLLKQRVLELTLKNNTRKQISALVNRSSTKVYHLQRELVADGQLQVNQSGHIIKLKPERLAKKYEDLSQTEFLQIESVRRWRDSLKRSDVKKYRYMIVNFWKVCKTLDVHPDSFLISDMNEVNPMIDRFTNMFKEGKTHYLKKNPVKDPIKQSRANPQHYIEAVRSFIKRNGGEIPDGDLVIKRGPLDRYSHSKLTDNQRLKGIKFMRNISEQLGDIFTLHNETGLRSHTLLTMKPRFEKFTRVFDGADENDPIKLPVTCTWYKTLVFESKQEKFSKGGYFAKYILTPKAKAVVERLKEDEPIHNIKSIITIKNDYNQRLRELYASFGLISSNPIEQKSYEEKTQKWYYVNNPTGVIRHSCVHWLMRITGNNASAVSTLFHEKVETLKIYAQQSFDDLLQINDCSFCRPTEDQDNRFRRYCCLKHALIYFNNGGKTKKEMIEELT